MTDREEAGMDPLHAHIHTPCCRYRSWRSVDVEVRGQLWCSNPSASANQRLATLKELVSTSYIRHAMFAATACLLQGAVQTRAPGAFR